MVKHYLSADLLGMTLRQLGASKVQINSSKILFVEFAIGQDLNVSYFCNIKDESKIYIQRIEPYPIRNYGFESVDNILKFIENDVKLFENASHSSNFPLFLKLIDTNYLVRKEIERLFLTNNVPQGLLADLLKDASKLMDKLKTAEIDSLGDDICNLSDGYHDIIALAKEIEPEYDIDNALSSSDVSTPIKNNLNEKL